MAHSSKVFSVYSAKCTLVEEREINEDGATFLWSNKYPGWIMKIAAQTIQ